MLNRLAILILALAFVLFYNPSANGQTLTAQQIEQFKRMPQAQKDAMAKQLGIDLSSLQTDNTKPITESPTQVVYPRGTQFDEQGNPIQTLPEGPEEASSEPKLYGVDLFANGPSSFTQVTDIPIPANYILGPGDIIQLQLFGKENEYYELQVDRDGNITVPKLGPFNVATKSFTEVKAYLANQINQQVIGVEVSVSLGELRSMRIFVMGEAHKPGAYNVSSLATITQAIFAAGGVSSIASLRGIQLKRAGKLVETLDLYDLMLNGDASKDVRLEPGDVVLIPTVENTVIVDGLVRRPAIYELKSEQRLSQVIGLAGGLLPEAYSDGIGIVRFKGGQQIQITAAYQDKQLRIQAGDQISVLPVSPIVQESVTLIGAVARPGNYQWKDALSLFDLVGDKFRQLLPEADLSYVLVLRQDADDLSITPFQFDLKTLYAKGKQAFPTLQANDKILVFSKHENEAIDDVKLSELAFNQETLVAKEEERWQQRIEDKLFWQKVGLIDPDKMELSEEELTRYRQQALIRLDTLEQEKILELKDAPYYSRKRMLAPVIEMLQAQAQFDRPAQLVEVDGEVRVPGLYPLSQDADVADMIRAAGGLTESAYPGKSEITRTLMQEGVIAIEHIDFSPSRVLQGQDHIALQSKDRINVFTIPSWQKELKVEVRGEVKFPGMYTIKRGETLRDLITRVGGLTPNGDANAAVFTREALKVKERENLQNLAEELRKQIASEGLRRNTGAGSIVSYDEAKKLLKDLTKAEAVGRLVIDLTAIVNGKTDTGVILENRDVLYVPNLSQSVNVIGEVYVPTSHLFTSQSSYEDYIMQSGGYKELADNSRTYIIRANGAVVVPRTSNGFWFSNTQHAQVVQPGDTIVVPLDADRIDNMTLWTNATQIIYQLAVAVTAISRL